MRTTASRPEETTEVFVDNFNAGDIDQLIRNYYAPGAVLAGAPGQPAAGERLRGELSRYFELRGKMTATTRHVLASGDTALLVIDWEIDARDPSGNAVKIPGTSTDVVRKGADGNWRCIIDNPHGTK
jgi:ketosteroid isomerase-like protein